MSAGFDPLSPAFAANPYAAYAALRAKPEPVWFAPFGGWLLARHGDILTATQDRSMVRSAEAAFDPATCKAMQRAENFHDMPYHERYVQTSMLECDGPAHDRLRALVQRHFTPSRLHSVQAETEQVVAERLEVLAEAGQADFVADVAAEIPGRVIGHLIGVPRADCALLRHWSEDTVRYFDIDRTPAKKAAAEAAVQAFAAYLSAMIAERRRAPQPDLLSALVAETDQGALSEAALISLVMLILMAGHGSTIDVMSSGAHRLAADPALQARLRAEPGLWPRCIQEMFRFESPLPFFHRYVTEPRVIAGRRFEPGDKIGLLYGSANRDAAVFDDPDHFRADRAPNKHLAFGHGAHFCLGNHLARQEMAVMFPALLDRFAELTLLETPPYKPGLSVRGPKALRLAVKPAFG